LYSFNRQFAVTTTFLWPVSCCCIPVSLQQLFACCRWGLSL
jgi:hypothetical protein